MTSASRRDISALRQTDVRDGEVEKSLTFRSEKSCTVMCEQSFIDVRATPDHTEREKVLLPACPRFKTAHLLPITLPPSSTFPIRSAMCPCVCFYTFAPYLYLKDVFFFCIRHALVSGRLQQHNMTVLAGPSWGLPNDGRPRNPPEGYPHGRAN